VMGEARFDRPFSDGKWCGPRVAEPSDASPRDGAAVSSRTVGSRVDATWRETRSTFDELATGGVTETRAQVTLASDSPLLATRALPLSGASEDNDAGSTPSL
ncbi:MAG: hypothetical protein ACRET4_01545, partial [Steroidobacteraceae bacterium]